jgi:cytochrome P450
MAFCQAPREFLLEVALKGPGARFRMNDETFMVLADPGSVHAVLNGRLEDFEKGAMAEIPRTSWRDGIFTVDGSGWTGQHAMIAPAFARRRIRQLEPFIAERTRRLIATWAALPSGEPVDLLRAANRLAFEVAAEGLLGIDDAALAQALFDTLGELDRTESVRLNYLLKRLGAGVEGRFGRSPHAEAVARMDWLTQEVADRRLARADQPDDLIGAVMASEGFAALSPGRRRALLADQVATLLAAGYVTTGESLFWGLYLLAAHPAAQTRARTEVLAETAASSGAVPVEAPPFLAAALSEAQRLHPPVWFMGRVARRDVRVGDLEIAGGTRVVCSPHVLHRMPALWPHSDRYRPERFLPDASPAVPPRAFIPFGTGMRACLGRGLALMEMCALASMTLARFELELASDAPAAPTSAFSTHPREPVLFRLKPLA